MELIQMHDGGTVFGVDMDALVLLTKTTRTIFLICVFTQGLHLENIFLCLLALFFWYTAPLQQHPYISTSVFCVSQLTNQLTLCKHRVKKKTRFNVVRSQKSYFTYRCIFTQILQ